MNNQQDAVTTVATRKRHVESTVFLLLANALLVLATAEIHLVLLSLVDSAYVWQRSGTIEFLLVAYGMAFLLLALLSSAASARGILLSERTLRYSSDVSAMLRTDLLPAMRRCFRSRQTIAWISLALAIGIAVRATFLAQPMRYDEAYTFLNFINGTFTRVFHYPIPNNHVLHTMLAKLSTLLWGAHPESIRLPAFVAGTLSIPLTFYLCRTLLGGRSGLFASLSMAVFPYMVLYSTNARGYSLLVFLSLALMLVGAHFIRTPSVPVSAILSVIAAFGLITIPTMAFPIAGIYLWLFCAYLLNGHSRERVVRRFVVPCAIMTVALGAVLYSPVVLITNGAESLVSNEFVQAQPSEEFLSQVYFHLAETFRDFTRDIPGALLLFILVLMAGGVYSAVKRRNWALLLILPSLFTASAAMFLLKHAIPYPRTWIFFIPFVFVVADAGWTFFIEKLPSTLQKAASQGLVAAAVFYGMFLISTKAVVKYDDTGNFPEARVVANYLKSVIDHNDGVDGWAPADYTTYFYLWYQNVGDIRSRRDGNSQDKFFVVQKSGRSIAEITKDEVVKIFEVADAAVYKSLER